MLGTDPNPTVPQVSPDDISSHDARFSQELGGEEYDDLLIALEFYDEFQAQAGIALADYIKEHGEGLETIKVLEAGPGTGLTTMQLLQADPRVKIVSVDNEPKMLEAVRSKFASVEELKDRVDFVLSDILAFLEKCEDSSFDAFASVYTLHNFTPEFRERVIKLIAKKLKPGGTFINGDKYAEEVEEHKRDLANELNNFNKFDVAADLAEQAGDTARAQHLRQIKEEWTKHTLEDNENRISVAEQEEMLKNLGFGDIEWGKRFDLVTTVSAIKK